MEVCRFTEEVLEVPLFLLLEGKLDLGVVVEEEGVLLVEESLLLESVPGTSDVLLLAQCFQLVCWRVVVVVVEQQALCTR